MVKKILVCYLMLNLAMPGFLPAPEVHAQEKKVYTLAAMTFDAKGVSEIEAEVLSEKFRAHISEIIESPEFKARDDRDQYLVVEQSQIDKILEQFEIQNIGCVSDSCAIVFGRMLQVDRIVIGQIGLVGNTFLVSARIVDVESRKAISSSSREHKGSIDELMSTVILDVGNDLFLGRKKKSKKMWYVLGGIIIVGAGAAASMGGGGSDPAGGGGGSDTSPTLLPLPPGRP